MTMNLTNNKSYASDTFVAAVPPSISKSDASDTFALIYRKGDTSLWRFRRYDLIVSECDVEPRTINDPSQMNMQVYRGMRFGDSKKSRIGISFRFSTFP